MEKRTKFDVFISFASQDSYIAQKLTSVLDSRGISVWTMNNLNHSAPWAEEIFKAITSTRYFVPIVTRNSVNSDYCLKELAVACHAAQNRMKVILPVCFDPAIVGPTPQVAFHLSRYQFLVPEDSSDAAIYKIAGKIADTIERDTSSNLEFEKLSEYIRAGINGKATEILCSMITENCKNIRMGSSDADTFNAIAGILDQVEKVAQLYDYEYGAEGRRLAHVKLDMLKAVSSLQSLCSDMDDDLRFISSAIRLIYFDREIRRDCADAITGGDVSDGIVHTLPESEYAEKQADFVARYNAQMQLQHISGDNAGSYSEAEHRFIIGTSEYIYQQKRTAKLESGTASGDDQLLHSVAAFMKEGNRLFDMIGQHEMAEDFMKCLLTSYERLKAYCEVVGEKKICAECIDRIIELKSKLEKANFGKTSEKADVGIKTLLGITPPNSGKYDVFISHKSDDYDIAESMYHFFKRNLKEAFFDKYSLPDLGEAQYRRSIMQALENSRHFVVVFSDIGYLESKWVQLEMEIFASEIDEGRKEGAGFILVATNNVYDDIIKSNKKLLPIQFRRYEIMRLEEYQQKILKYID